MKKLLFGVVLSLFACGGDSTAPLPSLNGTWALQSVAGSPLPYATDINNSVVSDVFVLRSDGTLSETFTGIHTGNQFTTTSSGTWLFDGSTLHIEDPGFVFTEGTPDPETHQTIQFVLNNQVWLYTRQ